MLEIRPTCENCDKLLPNNASDAMICTYECTFCENCVNVILKNVCPNCGGGFEKRPTRPHSQLPNHPVRMSRVFKPVVSEEFRIVLKKMKDIEPRMR